MDEEEGTATVPAAVGRFVERVRLVGVDGGGEGLLVDAEVVVADAVQVEVEEIDPGAREGRHEVACEHQADPPVGRPGSEPPNESAHHHLGPSPIRSFIITVSGAETIIRQESTVDSGGPGQAFPFTDPWEVVCATSASRNRGNRNIVNLAPVPVVAVVHCHDEAKYRVRERNMESKEQPTSS